MIRGVLPKPMNLSTPNGWSRDRTVCTLTDIREWYEARGFTACPDCGEIVARGTACMSNDHYVDERQIAIPSRSAILG